MARPKAQLRLGAFFNPTGHHVASWRHPRAQADAGINFQHYVEIAQTAERGKFDMVFLADNVCVREAKMEALSRSAQYIANFEPITLLSALAAVTSHIGLVAQRRTSYNEPFHVARKFASLDHISGGRAGWNLVTSGHVGGGAQLQPRRPLRPRRALRARERVRRDRCRAVGFMGRRRLPARQGERAVLRAGEAAYAQPQGQKFPGARAAQHPSPAAGPSGDRTGRRLRRRHGRRGALRRGDLRRAARDRGVAVVLQGGEGTGAGQVRPQPRSSQGHAGLVGLCRPHRGRSATRSSNTRTR